MLVLLLSIYPTQQEARADCIGYEPPDPECNTTCDQLQAAAKKECEGLHQEGSDIDYQWLPNGCTITLDGCAKAALGKCVPFTAGSIPDIQGQGG